jgi:hypothetical protein
LAYNCAPNEVETKYIFPSASRPHRTNAKPGKYVSAPAARDNARIVWEKVIGNGFQKTLDKIKKIPVANR